MVRLLDAGAAIDAADARGWTPLLRAVQNYHPAMARMLIERGADVNARDQRGRTALHWAAQYGPAETARLLLERGAEVDAADDHGVAPLHRAIVNGRTEIVRLLLASDRWRYVPRDWQWRKGMALAIAHRRLGAVAALLDAGMNANTSLIEWEVTPLLDAAKRGDVGIVRLLLARGADPAVKTTARRSALTCALAGGHEAVVRLLLDAGKGRIRIGLEEAVVTNDAALVADLLDEGVPDVEMVGSQHETLLAWAATNREPEIARLLVERRGADIDAGRSIPFATPPLAGAASAGDLDLLIYLIERGADPLPRDGDAPTNRIPLARAAEKGHRHVVEWLLAHVPHDPNTSGPVAAALVAAAQGGHIEIVRLLLDAGFPPDGRDVASWHQTALICAAHAGRADITALLLERGATPSLRSEGGGTGDTALGLAAAAGRKRTTRLLVEHGAIQEDKDAALLGALQYGHIATATILLEEGNANPNAAALGYRRWTALHLAAGHGTPAVVASLLSRGADRNAADRDGKDALAWAATNPRYAAEITRLLREHRGQ